MDGWGCSVIDDSLNKIELGEICGNILGKPVLSLTYAFGGCVEGEYGLTFEAMKNLKTAPAIPFGVKNMDWAFDNCANLTHAPVIPSSVTGLICTFRECTSLVYVPEIQFGVTNMFGTFSGCTSLKNAPVIPSSVTEMYNTFSGCTSLENVPAIPASVEDMSFTFSSCTNLAGELYIKSASVNNFSNCFYDLTQALTVKVPENSTTYSTITTADLGSDTIIIETFVP